jgi:hypothetical protein
MCMVAVRPIAALPAPRGQAHASIKLIIDLLVPELRRSHDSIDRFFEQATVDAAHVHHTTASLSQQMSHLIGRLDLPKTHFHIQFEQPLERALAA